MMSCMVEAGFSERMLKNGTLRSIQFMMLTDRLEFIIEMLFATFGAYSAS